MTALDGDQTEIAGEGDSVLYRPLTDVSAFGKGSDSGFTRTAFATRKHNSREDRLNGNRQMFDEARRDRTHSGDDASLAFPRRDLRGDFRYPPAPGCYPGLDVDNSSSVGSGGDDPTCLQNKESLASLVRRGGALLQLPEGAGLGHGGVIVISEFAVAPHAGGPGKQFMYLLRASAGKQVNGVVSAKRR